MASRDDFLAFIQENASKNAFEPYAYYGAEEDALTIYFSDKPDYRKRLNSRVTVYLSLDDNELVGVRIKSVRHVLEDIRSFNMSIKHGKVRLDLLFTMLHGPFDENEEARRVYRRVGKAVSISPIEVDVPDGEPCGAS